MKSLLLELNLTSESISVNEIYVFVVELNSGSIIVNQINVLELKIELWLDPCQWKQRVWVPRRVQANRSGAHLGGFISKSIEFNEEMNEFRDEVLNGVWDL